MAWNNEGYFFDVVTSIGSVYNLHNKQAHRYLHELTTDGVKCIEHKH